ncbi:bifunctional phosphopantothenoylcysteine decarboxylase/phosphopantothenate--cysteine ligase CoaBC [Helicobacter pametensis]|uniref:bifunctional phosphopantothenoylcysteine decarboxylase/phosphopantothenate--cysteine ligase CoaBC n=1 Tax=Helicobacter pametensis TaxID=95149 RepID=UPI0006865FBC|nr:bifunctional phosphopantothenoylcysteine decarboxylase/phosphopantothenate--cysteine ligase CoaBC [Helicobacter pametensis]
MKDCLRWLGDSVLRGRRILICVSGGIAIYKSLELVRFFKKRGAEVRVAMTPAALRFVSPLTFEALSENPVLFEESEDWGRGVTHISYASWAEVCILAPATMNTLSKFAYGMADNTLLSTMLACSAPIIIAPAANTQMFLSPQSQEAISKLKEMGCWIVEPREDVLACGVYGIGAMQEIEEIAFVAMRSINQCSFWRDQNVIVSGGGSFEGIDEVRCITNYSSGMQASYFTLALYLLGANVCFVSSAWPITLPSKIKQIQVKKTQEFWEAILAHQSWGDYYFGIAALSDFIPKEQMLGKLKKENGLEVEFVENIDILKSLEGIKKIGFKAEKDSQNAYQYAQKMLREKRCEFVCLNIIGEENPFGSSKNAISLIGQDGVHEFGLSDKFTLALDVLKKIADVSK